MSSPSWLPVLCLALLGWGHVTSFSIRHRTERSTDLADALAILQRQRRRVEPNFLQSPDRLLEDEPLTLQDVSDWFNGATAGSKVGYESDDGDDDGGMESDWLPELGGYKDFEPSDMGYDLRPDVYPTAPIKATPAEIEAIFEADGDEESPRSEEGNPTLSKKTKEEMVNVKGDRNIKPKSSGSNSVVKPASRKRGSPNEVLNSLTKEEVKVLMKAVGKLQEQLGNSKDDGDDDEGFDEDEEISNGDEPGTEEAIVVSEPVSQEELKSVFEETDGPVTKETRILLEKGPGEKEPTLVEEQVVTEKLPEISEDEDEEEVEKELTKALTNELANELEEERESEEEAAEEAVADVAAAAVAAANLENESGEDVGDGGILGDEDEDDDEVPLDLEAQKLATKYWLLNGDKFYPQAHKGLKRTAKRASGLFEDAKDSPGHKGAPSTFEHLGKGNNHAQINLSWLSPQLQAFVLKIISLQDEVDRLKLEARLEDLENDALTDALNEATLAQMEGTVSDVEWSSLQQAISLEAALQDIKHSKPASILSGNEGEADAVAAAAAADGDDDDNIMDNEIKRGEPWRRKRLPSSMPEPDDVTDEELDSDWSLARYGAGDDDIKNRAIEKLLEQSYFLKGRPGAEEEGSEDIASLFMPDPERCPAVQRYSSNCALADLYSVPVDFEARALCNLHEMCYTCGMSLGVEQGQCDLVYRTAAASLCKGKDECEAEAEVFLRAMKLKTRYIAHAQPTCRSRCTAEFLGMF